jgi:hypothetical protein
MEGEVELVAQGAGGGKGVVDVEVPAGDEVAQLHLELLAHRYAAFRVDFEGGHREWVGLFLLLQGKA